MVLVFFFFILCALIFFSYVIYFFSIHHHFESYISHFSLCWLWPPLEMTKRSKSINSKILTLQTPLLGNSICMINVSFRVLFRKDVIPNFENTYNLTILCNLHFTIIFNTTYSKPSISPNLRTLQIRSSHARLSGSYNTEHCQDNTICLLAKKKKLIVWRHQCLRFPSREPNFGMHLLSWMSQWWYLS